MDALEALTATKDAYAKTKEVHDNAAKAAIKAAVDAVRDDMPMAEIEANSPFTAAYIRRHAREAGIEPRKKGPKSSKESAGRRADA